MFARALPVLRSQVSSVGRRYATSAPASGSSNLAPILLGVGLVGAGGAYYSTLPSSKKNELEGKAKDAAKQAEAKGAAIVDSAKSKVGATTAALSKDEWRDFELVDVKPYNHNTSSFTFALPAGTDSGLTVASALVTRSASDAASPLTKDGKPVVRPYTPVTAPGVEGKIELLIKKYKGGAMTEHIHGLKKGDKLALKGPIPKFAYKANEFETVALIAGGSGITPMWQIMQEIDSNPNDKTKATLVFGNVSESDILLREKFEDLAQRKPDQFKVHFVLDSPPKGWTGPSGYIDQKVLAQALPGPAFGDRIKVFVCGPPGQVAAIAGGKKSPSDQGELKGVLADMGYLPNQVYKF